MIGLFFAMSSFADDVDVPTSGVVLSLDAYGEAILGHVMVDADALAAIGIQVAMGATPRTGKVVPYLHGLRVLGLPKGERLVEDAVDSLLYFDANGDGYLDATDPAFPALALFVDKNHDQVVQAGEIRTFASIGIEAISRFGSIRVADRKIP